MRKISILLTILVTSFVMALAGLVASPIAAASENGNGSISATFPLGSSVLSDAQKAAIKKTVASSGSDVSFIVTGTAGKLPGISDRWVQRLAKKRAQAIKAYLVSLGVSKTSVTIQTKVTEIGVGPKSTGSYPTPAPTPTATATSTTTTTPTTPGPACSAGGTCIVGDRGPGGGIVFYVSAANFASVGSACSPTCKYLEVAPATWRSAGASVADDVFSKWSTDESIFTTQVLSVASTTESGFTDGATPPTLIEQENWKIGKGFSNTGLIRVTSTAKVAVLAYAGTSSAGQWFIPSMNELNELCKFARGQTTGVLTVPCVTGSGIFKSTVNAGSDLGGFADDAFTTYWSSSEYNANRAWGQYFGSGLQNNSSWKSNDSYVRPIRAF